MTGRLDAEATRALDDAREIARRFRHGTVEPEHLLLALATSRGARPAFRERFVDLSALAERLEARLTDWPTSGLYRDPGLGSAPLAPALDTICRRAGASGFVARLLAPVSILHLARVACEERALAALLFEARAEIATSDEALVHARLLARARGHDDVSVHHVMRALASQGWVDAILRDARVDVDALIAALDRELDATTCVTRETRASFEFHAPCARSQLLAHLLRWPTIEELFWMQQLAVVDVLHALVRATDAVVDDGALPPDYEPALFDSSRDTLPPATDDPVAIVLHDDDFTTMELGLLQRAFAVREEVAMTLMLRVRETRASVVKTCSSREARWRIDKARTLARRAALPLRITWREARPDA